MKRLQGLMDALPAVAVNLLRRLVDVAEAFPEEVVVRFSPGTVRELNRRRRERPWHAGQWFTADESRLVAAVADLLIPSDETGPGVAGMLGGSVVEALDRVVAGSPRRQTLYARGLLALDRWAVKVFRSRFIHLSQPNQLRLLQLADRRSGGRSGSGGRVAWIKRKVVALLHDRWRGWSPAAQLFPTLVQDVLQAFYTDPVSWAWLGYDGPPMPRGYPVLDRAARG